MTGVRLDDLGLGGRSFAFEGVVGEGRADSLDDVVGAVASAEEASRGGAWVVFALSYEAAPAFDPALVVRSGSGFPLVWWRAFRGRVEVERISDPGVFPLVGNVSSPLSGFPDVVRAAQERIRAGTIYQANLAVQVTADLVADPRTLYYALASAQASRWCALLDVDGVTVASASPELFFRVDDGQLTCRPMKGTRDPARADELGTDPKERAENIMIVDLLRNDMARVAEPGSVLVRDLMSVERYPTVAQATSTIGARLRPDATLVDILAALFPCGSVTGAPKVTAMRTIAELETFARGVYCGAIGVLAPGRPLRAEVSVPIRTAVIAGRTVTYGTGAGITLPSDPGAEARELALKADILTRLASPLAPPMSQM